MGGNINQSKAFDEDAIENVLPTTTDSPTSADTPTSTDGAVDPGDKN